MDLRAHTSYAATAAAVRVLSLLLAVLAVAMAEAREPEGAWNGPANYTFETFYDLRPGSSAAFDRFWLALKHSSTHGIGMARYVDAVEDTDHMRRVVTLPVKHLAEYGADRRNEDVLRGALGEDAARAIIGDFNDAQLSRTSYLRQFRTDLSVNRHLHRRGTAEEVSFVTVVEGDEPGFERLWRRAVDAYRTIAPMEVISVSRTLVGDGPQFVIARPVELETAPAALQPAEAVRQAYGNKAAREFEEELRDVVVSWRTVTHTNLGLDTPRIPHGVRR